MFPKLFKIAKVVPLYTKGNRDDPAIYQWISRLSSLSEVLEKIIHKGLLDFSTKFSFLCPAQYGFGDELSCVDAIAAVTEYMRSEVDKKAQGTGCIIELPKFQGKTHDIIGSYRVDRQQYISCNGTSTPCLIIKFGVPQGSVLGPSLFLFYINDITLEEIDCKLAIFADDTTIIKSNREECGSIQQGIDRLFEWFCSNKLRISNDKCELISFVRGLSGILRIYKSACKYLDAYADRYLYTVSIRVCSEETQYLLWSYL